MSDYQVKKTHSGQHRAYGDTSNEYEIRSSNDRSDVEKHCREHVHKCDLPYQQWVDEHNANRTAENHFRRYYRFNKIGDDLYFYSVIFPFTD